MDYGASMAPRQRGASLGDEAGRVCSDPGINLNKESHVCTVEEKGTDTRYLKISLCSVSESELA